MYDHLYIHTLTDILKVRLDCVKLYISKLASVLLMLYMDAFKERKLRQYLPDRSLGEFSVDHSTKVKARFLGSVSIYKGFMRSFINRILISAVKIKLAFVMGYKPVLYYLCQPPVATKQTILLKICKHIIYLVAIVFIFVF